MDFLKLLLLDEASLSRLRQLDNIEEIINFLKPYYSELEIKKLDIVEIEKALFSTYIRLIGKIMIYSPENMRYFLRNFLLKYEIYNIKQVIIGIIIGMSKEERRANVNFTVEKYLENEEFMNKVLEFTSLEELEFFLRKTRYNKVIREGLLYFRNTGEIFVLEAFLDQLYYKNLVSMQRSFNKKEREMIKLFVNYIVEIYNLNMIYRGIKNNVERKLLSQFLIKNYLFLTEGRMFQLLELDDVDIFIKYLRAIYKITPGIKEIYNDGYINPLYLRRSLENLYIDYYFKKFRAKVGDIEYSTIYKILEILIKKEKEIKFEILPKLVQILNEKFTLLK
ncbi:MAG: V-type ATPase subunit [Promethearchaeota archaeon]